MISPCLFLQRLGVEDLSLPKPPTMREIASEVAERHGVKVDEMRGPSRKRYFVHPRQEAFALIRANTSLSYPNIGRYFNRDHTTVIHGEKAHNDRQAAAMAMAAE